MKTGCLLRRAMPVLHTGPAAKPPGRRGAAPSQCARSQSYRHPEGTWRSLGAARARFRGAALAGYRRPHPDPKPPPAGAPPPAGSGREGLSPEEEPEGARVAQVHAEHAADLLQGAVPLGLVPAGRRRQALAVGAAGGAGGAGHVLATRLSVRAARGQGGGVGATLAHGPAQEHRQDPASRTGGRHP